QDQQPERGDRAPGVGQVDREHRASPGVPDRDPGRDPDERGEQQRQAAVAEVRQDLPRDAAGPLPVGGLAYPVPRPAEEAHERTAHGGSTRRLRTGTRSQATASAMISTMPT